MTDRDEELIEHLQSLDPTGIDAPPAPGSTRYDHIKETIMTNIEPSSPPTPPSQQPATAEQRPSPPRLLLVGAAAVAVVLVAAVGLFATGNSTPSAAAAVRAAAQNSADIETFRMTFTSDDLAFLPEGSATGAVDGNDVHLVAGDMEMIRIGDTEWFGQGGQFQSGPAEVFTPFAEASSQVITAALASDDVTEEGAQILSGIETVRYRIELDDASREALANVPAQSQYWFTAETSESAEVTFDDDGNEVVVSAGRSGFLEDADAISLSIADDLIHQIEVSTGTTQFTITFFDFGADITITPPN